MDVRGFIRIDRVHHGEQDGVTQFEMVATCQRLSEAYLRPVLQALLDHFPFKTLGVHADNGSDYITYTVANRLEKRRGEFTQARPRHSTDTGWAETNNGALGRQPLGYRHSPQRYAREVNAFCPEFLNPWGNFHRPCFFAESFTEDRGKTRKRSLLKNRMTPYEKLQSLPTVKRFLKPGVPVKRLDQTAKGISDYEAARRLNEARNKLFLSLNQRSKRAA